MLWRWRLGERGQEGEEERDECHDGKLGLEREKRSGNLIIFKQKDRAVWHIHLGLVGKSWNFHNGTHSGKWEQRSAEAGHWRPR